MATEYPYTKELNGHDILITGPISVVTVDDNNYEIVDDAARTDLANLSSSMTTLVNGIKNATNTSFKNALIDLLYPVGAIYISVNNHAPFSRGTWTKIGSGRALVGVATGENYPAALKRVNGEYGSRNTVVPYHRHTATVGSHTHAIAHHHAMGDKDHPNVPVYRGTGSTEEIGPVPNGKWEIWQIGKTGQWAHKQTTGTSSQQVSGAASPSVSIAYAGNEGNAVNANFQPSLAVYIWKRTG